MNNLTITAKDFFGDMYEAYQALKTVKPDKYVYIANFKDGIVKIGVSKNPTKRINTILSQSGRELLKLYISEIMPHAKAYQIENQLKNQLSPNKVKGEFFCANYETIVELLQKYLN